MSSVTLHPPSASTPQSGSPTTTAVRSSTTDTLVGKWYITHTTSPVWRDKRNVAVTYTALPSSTGNNTERSRLDDLITYQSLTSPKIQTMRGTDTPSLSSPNSWTWRGHGLLKFVTSQWEIVGRNEPPKDGGDGAGAKGGGWMAAFAQKSLFSPAVLNICTKDESALDDERLEELKLALKDLGNAELGNLTNDLYRVKHE